MEPCKQRLKKPFASAALLMLPSYPRELIKISGMLKYQSRSGKWKNRLKNWITPPT